MLRPSANGVTKVPLINSIASQDLAMRMFYIPYLTAKGILVLFAPKRALIIDAEENFGVINVAKLPSDQLHYIGTNDYGTDYKYDEYTDMKNTRAMTAIIPNSIGDELELLLSTDGIYSDKSSNFNSKSASHGGTSIPSEDLCIVSSKSI